MTTPGRGGQVTISARDDTDDGSVTFLGEIFADGGSVLMGGRGAGAAAGRIDAQLDTDRRERSRLARRRGYLWWAVARAAPRWPAVVGTSIFSPTMET